jgi:hypothetical protein
MNCARQGVGGNLGRRNEGLHPGCETWGVWYNQCGSVDHRVAPCVRGARGGGFSAHEENLCPFATEPKKK